MSRLIASNLRIQPRYICSRLYGDCLRFQYTWPFSASHCFFLSLYWHIFIARAIHGHRELRRDRNESTLHSLPLPRLVHIKSVFDRQSSIWSGKEKSRKGTAIKKKESLVHVPEVRLETGCWWKRVPDAFAFSFADLSSNMIFFSQYPLDLLALIYVSGLRTMTVFLRGLLPRACCIKRTKRRIPADLVASFRNDYGPPRPCTDPCFTYGTNLLGAYSLRARHARTIWYVLAGCMPTYEPPCCAKGYRVF